MAKRRAARVGAVVFGTALWLGCGGKSRVSDTGYVGTWARGNDRIRSTVAVVRDGALWRTRVGVRSSDGTYQIRCGWDGRCEEVQDGAKLRDLTFRSAVDPGSGHLRVECVGLPVDPAKPGSRTVEEWVVAPGGLILTAWTVERDGQRFDETARPRRDFEKVSDDVKEPPAAGNTP